MIRRFWQLLSTEYIIMLDRIEFDIECNLCDNDCFHIERREFSDDGKIHYRHFDLKAIKCIEDLFNDKSYLWPYKYKLLTKIQKMKGSKYSFKRHERSRELCIENAHFFIPYCSKIGCWSFVAHRKSLCYDHC